ncbi:hypothetical protein GLE_5130 [Lysobacter enzymogenes]|uniref:Uncharacterized protein n=1 Tax=Lysobacter enzymogenes TaxID=69 RepID=A0A0S2DP74_LYSEN|nr:hypothetical protein GLE_5130 [Lysobacter enzymogenes]
MSRVGRILPERADGTHVVLRGLCRSGHNLAPFFPALRSHA